MLPINTHYEVNWMNRPPERCILMHKRGSFHGLDVGVRCGWLLTNPAHLPRAELKIIPSSRGRGKASAGATPFS